MTLPDPRFFWRDRPVLVTGATGLQGSWLVRALIEHQADVVALIRDWVPQSELCRSGLIERIKVVRGEVQDQALMERLLGEYEIVTVFHLAAQAIVPIANRNPLSTFESNIRGTWTVLEACRRSSLVKQIAVASSDKAYGDASGVPYCEDDVLAAEFPYDVSKACADLLAQSYAKTFELPVAIARCGNLYGGGDLNWNRIIPGTIRSVIRRQPPVIRSDGSPMRDYFYVEDGALAYLRLTEQLAEQPPLRGEAFNFSDGRPIRVKDVVDRILTLMGARDLKPTILNEATHEIPQQTLDATKAREQLEWQSQFTFEDGLRRTIAWYQAYFQEARHDD